MIDNFTDIELEREQWRDIEGYDGMYQVSDLGRVRSRYSGEWRVIKFKKHRNGYLRVDLYKDKKVKCYLIHRLVASAFIPNDDDSKTIINHIDESKQNNRVSNLEWCTIQYNSTYNDVHLRKNNCKQIKIKDIYNPDLSIKQNLTIFRVNGIECSEMVIKRLRRNLNLKDRSNYKQNEIKKLYRPDLSIDDNIKMFKSNGIECSYSTVCKLRKDLGLSRPRKKTN